MADPTAETITEEAVETVEDAVETVESLAEDITESVSPFLDYGHQVAQRFIEQFSGLDGVISLAILVAAAFVGWSLRRPVHALVEQVWPNVDQGRPFLGNLKHVVHRVAVPFVLAVLLWIAIPVLRELGVVNEVLRIVASMLQAWIVINLFSAVVRDPSWSRTFAAVAWVLAALYIMRLLNPLIALLDGMSMTLGTSVISLYDIIKASGLLVILIWLARAFVSFVQARLNRSQNLAPAVRSLIVQTVKLLTLFVAVLLALNAVGVDLTALAVFSGALGVGIGIGLQAIVANLFSGLTLMMEGAIKVGDYIELPSGVRGEVKEISTRATRITTNDNVDILVPNSEFVNGQVVNWTLKDRVCRVHIPFGVAYGSDKELVRKAALEAAAEVEHELKGPGSRPAEVWLTNFGASSLDFELVVWLKPEAVQRQARVRADYNWALETALTKHGIEIPFPQLDLHVKPGAKPFIVTGKESES
ncbi:mechanosensitive ion channel family protein [Pseudoprimorskyibacter insulae]|uniref:Mechanosensitive channel MscK n=1 Tax=Pseudoprimorskyibacter insulae TaxID=1695997 RepID=A0A2R8B070_9RHOB|nr:mechanosensitive ion channel domain-containing protein [Pseudoprimorskyibacter insulae]SPF81663.1 Mechanosensitive channel MscK [Pseudoprimorskyibacter insulae]